MKGQSYVQGRVKKRSGIKYLHDGIDLPIMTIILSEAHRNK
jgi:hypothetical protein